MGDWGNGLMIRTVDPWFNFRATKYLVEHGFYKFWDWFDDRMLLRFSITLDTKLIDMRKQEHGILSDELRVVPSTPD
jgi:hypothetical protein